MNDLVARASATIDAHVDKVWDALVDPEAIRQYMFGTNVESDFNVGSDIFWRGEWQGKTYEDKGKILKKEDNRLLAYSHFSPLSGEEDVPENYHTVAIGLSGDDDKTKIELSQDGCDSEKEKLQFEQNWNMMLGELKKYIENEN